MRDLEIIKGLNTLLNPFIFKTDVDTTHDFNISNAYYYVLDTINYNVYKNAYNLELHIICSNNNKLKTLEELQQINDKVCKKAPTSSSYIIPKSVVRNYIREESGEHHFILEYYINLYK